MELHQITRPDHANTQGFIQRATQRIERKQPARVYATMALKLRLILAHQTKSCEVRIQDSVSLLKQTFPSVWKTWIQKP